MAPNLCADIITSYSGNTNSDAFSAKTAAAVCLLQNLLSQFGFNCLRTGLFELLKKKTAFL